MNLVLQHERGFSLIEVIILIFLFAVLLMGLLNIFDWQHKVYNLEMADIAATGSARTVMNSVTRYVAVATDIEASRTVSGTAYSTGGSTLVLKIPSINSSDAIIADTYDYVVYTVSGTAFTQIIEANGASTRDSGTKQLSNNVQSATFTYNNATVTAATQVTLDLQTRASYRGNKTVQARLIETIFLRNK